MNGALRWLRARMGVRVVSALAAAFAVAVVLVVAGFSLVLLLNQSLRATVEDSGIQQADILGQRIQGNFNGDVKQNALDATANRGDLVQVVTDYGNDSDDYRAPDGYAYVPDREDVQVLGSSMTLDGQPRMSRIVLSPGQEYTAPSTVITRADGTTDEVLIVAKGFSAQGRPITVLVGQELLPVHQAVDTVQLMTLVGVPILVLVAGFFTYLFAGRALRPVEDIRRRVADLTDRELSRRVPEPPTRDEVGRLAVTMNRMLSRLEDSQATQRRFVADASHELRSPLATVSTGLELLGAGMTRDSADLATVTTLRGETTRLTSLVENLLFLARADERGLTPRREEVDLDEIAEAERVRPSTDDGVAVTVSTEPVRVTGDRGQMVRVLRNLVDNARRHADRSVLVSVRADGAEAVVDVEDDGPGVPEADRSRVFERFVRLDEARARGDGGSGLGLAIVAELMAAHGGTAVAESSDTLGGARFRVRMPLIALDPDGSEEEVVAPSGEAGPVPDGPGTDAEPVRDDAAVSESPTPASREPMGGRRRSGSGSPTATQHPVTPHPTPRPSAPIATPEPPRSTPALDPPTGPLPIRPNTVGSPFDQNATRPLPIVRATGTAVADGRERDGRWNDGRKRDDRERDDRNGDDRATAGRRNGADRAHGRDGADAPRPRRG